MCAERERERKTEREPRAANGRRWSEGQASARARKRERERVKGTGQHKDAENERKKMHYSQTDDYLTLYRWSSFGCWLVMVTTFSSLLFFLSRIAFRLSFSFALHATSGLSSHTTLPILLTTATTRFFSPFFFFLCKKRDQRQRHTYNVTTIYFPSS